MSRLSQRLRACMVVVLALPVLWAMSACAPQPQTRGDGYMPLLPLPELVAQADAEQDLSDRALLAARAAADRLAMLEARAASLRAPVLDTEARAQLEAQRRRDPG